MAYVLELSNRKSNQNTNVDDDSSNSNIGYSNLRMLSPTNNINVNLNSVNHNNNNNDHVNEADVDDDNTSVKKMSSDTHDVDIHSDNKNYFNHYQFNNGDDLDHSGGGSGGGNPLNRGPFFDVSASKNVTALVGKMANLNCRIKNLGNKTVRTDWVRECVYSLYLSNVVGIVIVVDDDDDVGKEKQEPQITFSYTICESFSVAGDNLFLVESNHLRTAAYVVV